MTSQTGAASPSEILIAPAGRWSSLDLGELWAHRELIYFLTKRELQLRYRQSFFGVSWVVLQPLVLGAIFAVFFGNRLDIPSDGLPYAVFAVAGLVPWLFTAQAVGNAAESLVSDANLIAKVYFPRLSLPIAKALSLVLDLVIAFVVVIAVALAYGVGIEITFVWLPAFVLLGVVTTFGLGTLLAAINVRYRDVGLVVPMLIQVLLFVSPIIYPGSIITGDARYLYAINPMSAVLDGVRWSLFGTPFPGAAEVAISVASALVLLSAALIYFQRVQKSFADVI